MTLGGVAMVILATFAFTADFTLGEEIDPKLAAGPHDAQLADVRLHYVVAGHGPLLVVTSPGWGIGSLYLQRGLTPLEQRFTLLYIDTRGSGESSEPGNSKQMGVAVMADDIDHLRRYCGLDSINLIGHSNGGAIALDYAERYPQRVKKVVLVDTEVLDDRADSATQRFIALWRDDPRYKHAVEVVADESADDTDERFEAYFAAIAPLYFSDPDRYVPIFEKQAAGTHLFAFADKAQEAADKLAPRYQSREYNKVRAKMLIVNGTVDFACPVEVAERIHNGVRGSTLSIYANVGHFPWIEQPTRFFMEVSQFLGD